MESGAIRAGKTLSKERKGLLGAGVLTWLVFGPKGLILIGPAILAMLHAHGIDLDFDFN